MPVTHMKAAPASMKLAPITLFIFTSSVRTDLHSFVAEGGEGALPKQFAPWIKAGIVRATERPPHRLEREAIQRGIAEKGFQLWRKTKSDEGSRPLQPKAAKNKAG